MAADPNQREEDRQKTPLEFLFDHEFFVRMSRLPDLVTPAQRSRMALALLAAGARRPYQSVDAQMPTLPERERMDHHAADYLLWPSAVALTEGTEVLEALARTGTQPAMDADTALQSPLAYAARAGNIDAVRWLLPRTPARISDDNRYGLGENQLDPRVAAALWALYPAGGISRPEAHRRADAILRLLLQRDLAWQQEGDPTPKNNDTLLDWQNTPAPKTGNTLLHHLVMLGEPDWIRLALANGAPVDGTGQGEQSTPLSEAVAQARPEMVKVLLQHGANPLGTKEYGLGNTLGRKLNHNAPLYLAIKLASASEEDADNISTIDSPPDNRTTQSGHKPDAAHTGTATKSSSLARLQRQRTVLRLLLEALTPQQKAHIQALQPALFEQALSILSIL